MDESASTHGAYDGGWVSGTCQPARDPAGEVLTRLRAQHPGWQVYPVAGDWSGWCAFDTGTGHTVTAPTLLGLEVELAGR